MIKHITLLTLGLTVFHTSVIATEPDIKTPSPIIFLADNLDENQNLGWCIDTLGRGYSEQLQAHSCKPQGGDVQFKILADTEQIQSVAFPEKCMMLVDESNINVPFGLRDCDASNAAQKFTYSEDTLEIKLSSEPEKCVGVAAESRAAGPFMSRDLIIEDCKTLSKDRAQWRSLD